MCSIICVSKIIGFMNNKEKSTLIGFVSIFVKISHRRTNKEFGSVETVLPRPLYFSQHSWEKSRGGLGRTF